MTIETQFRVAALDWLRGDKTLKRLLNGMHESRPLRTEPPSLVVEDSLVADWSVKDRSGRETRLALVIEGRGETPARIGDITAAVESRLNAMPRAGDGYTIASIVFLRGRLARAEDGRWSQLIEYRVRLIED